MIRLQHLSRRSRANGVPIPSPYQTFTDAGIKLLRGETSMVVAAPGVGKTALALDVAIRSQVPTVYFAIDTPDHDMLGRAAANATGYPVESAVKYLDHPNVADKLAEKTANIQWCFDSGPTFADMSEELFAYAEIYGDWPQLIVVDNLTAADIESDSEYQGLRELIRKLNGLARKVSAHVMVLHHATGAYEDGDRKIPLGGIEFKLGKLPALVLTMHRYQQTFLISVVKNRHSVANAQGEYQVKLGADLSRMTLIDRSS